ncbi:hypothetical protein TNCV_3509101 [Trichonephila clavipes]|nr:hypothetical protein TNCV_3509101 [Trichonephila clavipes]
MKNESVFALESTPVLHKILFDESRLNSGSLSFKLSVLKQLERLDCYFPLLSSHFSKDPCGLSKRKTTGRSFREHDGNRHSEESDIKIAVLPDTSDLTEEERDDNEVNTSEIIIKAVPESLEGEYEDKVNGKMPTLINSYNKLMGDEDPHNWLAGLDFIKIRSKNDTGHFTGYGYCKRLDNSQNSRQR